MRPLVLFLVGAVLLEKCRQLGLFFSQLALDHSALSRVLFRFQQLLEVVDIRLCDPVRHPMLAARPFALGWNLAPNVSEASLNCSKVDTIEVASRSWFDGEMLRKFSFLTILVFGLTPAFAADSGQGRTIADRWCSSCHVVEHEQKTAATDQAPPFATIGKTPDFNAGKLALLLLKPHPNMPKLELSRSEIADLAEYIRTMSR